MKFVGSPLAYYMSDKDYKSNSKILFKYYKTWNINIFYKVDGFFTDRKMILIRK
jgi:hypothetical protein